MANARISELDPATIIAGTEPLAMAQDGATVRVTGDQMALHSLRRIGRRPIIGTAGDSIADLFGCGLGVNQTSSAIYTTSPLSWALALYPADIVVDGRNNANGGYNFGVGGSTSTQMLSTQLPQIAARPPDILLIQTHQNDPIVAVADIATYAANTEATAIGALAAGVKLVVILSCPPHNSRSGATRAKALAGLNERLARFATATPGVIYLDTLHQLLDPTAASSTLVPWRNSASPSAFGSYSTDGVHPTSFAAKALAPALADLLRMIAPPRVPRAIVFDGGYDNANNPRGNLLRNNGLFVGTGGLLSGVADAGVAAGWEVTTSNGVTVTPSLVTDALGYPAQRLTLGGSASAAAAVELKLGSVPSYLSPAPGAGDYEMEAQVALDALEGVTEVIASTGVGGPVTNVNLAVGPDPVTLSAFLASRRPAQFGSGNSFNHSVRLTIPNGVSPAGSIDISRFGVWRVD